MTPDNETRHKGELGKSEQLIPVSTASAVAPHGHYSQGMRCGDLVFISGILGNNQHWPPGTEPAVEQQALSCLLQIEAIAQAAGSARSLIVRVGIFVTDVASWPQVNEVYADFFGDHRPARIVVPCGSMRFNSLIEMEAVAYLDRAEEQR